MANVAVWERLTRPDFTVVNEHGHHMSRAERVAELKATKPAPVSTDYAQEHVTMYGNTAVRRYRQTSVWWIEVWVKSGAEWRAAAVQGTPAEK